MRVSICIITFRRPEGLRRLLAGLERLTFERVPAPDVELLVVDNDPDGSAEAVCAELAPALPWPLRYERESQPGLSHARNRAVASVRSRTELVAFIDDDEVPEPAWLDALVQVQGEYDADVVLGPTYRRFAGTVPAWVEKGRFFRDRQRPTGALVEHGGVGNSLIHTRVFELVDPPFDPRMSLSGGEDTLFFLRITRRGARIVWAGEALVYEWLPESRATARWILQRAYREANTWSLCERELQPSTRVLAMRATKGIGRIGMGLALLPGSVLGKHVLVRALWYLSFGVGNLAGMAGLRYQEYRAARG